MHLPKPSRPRRDPPHRAPAAPVGQGRGAEDRALGAQLFVLQQLRAAGGALTPGELSQRTLTHHVSVSGVVRRSSEGGHVHRVRSTTDARRIELRLTAAGRARCGAPMLAQRSLISAVDQMDDSRRTGARAGALAADPPLRSPRRSRRCSSKKERKVPEWNRQWPDDGRFAGRAVARSDAGRARVPPSARWSTAASSSSACSRILVAGAGRPRGQAADAAHRPRHQPRLLRPLSASLRLARRQPPRRRW